MGKSNAAYIVRGALAAIALVTVALQALAFFGVIENNSSLEMFLLFLGGIVVFGDNLRHILTRAKRGAEENRRRNIEKPVLACLKSISQSTGLDITAIGASVFEPVSDKKGEDRLKRSLRYRLNDYPQPSEVDWVSGKGAVGAAWKSRKHLHVNWSAIGDRYGSAEMSQAEFERIPKETRHGFDYEEFSAVADKYDEILAVPVWAGEDCVGVLSVDVPRMLEAGGGRGVMLARTRVYEIASTCADVLSDILSKK